MLTLHLMQDPDEMGIGDAPAEARLPKSPDMPLIGGSSAFGDCMRSSDSRSCSIPIYIESDCEDDASFTANQILLNIDSMGRNTGTH